MTQFEKLLKTPLILSATLATLIIISAPSSVFGAGDEPGKYLDRKAEIWNLFFKMMVVAFTIGSVVSGTIVWLVGDLGFRTQSLPNEAKGDW